MVPVTDLAPARTVPSRSPVVPPRSGAVPFFRNAYSIQRLPAPSSHT
jgi:hypothetical protein